MGFHNWDIRKEKIMKIKIKQKKKEKGQGWDCPILVVHS